MRDPLWRTIVSNEDQETRLFLADDHRRQRTIRTKMRKMPTTCANNTPTNRKSPQYHLHTPS